MADNVTPDTTASTSTAPVTAPPETAPQAPAKKAAAKKTAAKKAPATKAAAKKATTKKAASKKSAPADEPLVELPGVELSDSAEAPAPAKKTPAKRTAKKAPAKRAAKKPDAAEAAAPDDGAGTPELVSPPEVAPEAPAKKTPARRAAKKAVTAPVEAEAPALDAASTAADAAAAASVPAALFQAPEPVKAPRRRTRKAAAPVVVEPVEIDDEVDAVIDDADAEAALAAAVVEAVAEEDVDTTEAEVEDDSEDSDELSDDGTPARRRRRRGGRRRRKSGSSASAETEDDDTETDAEASEADTAEAEDSETGSSRRRRRRRRAGESGSNEDDAEPGVNTVVKVRESRPLDQQITAISGSTRLEAKKQRRREGREAGRRRAPIVSEAEFLARRESVERIMVVRQRDDLTQIGVIEDKVLVEHYVARDSQTSLIGNIYLGKVQNVLPSMEAAFVDIGKGRNAVLYAGEVNWSALGHKDGQARKIESVLSSGQTILVQVTKDPVGHKGARLTSQISLAGRFLVYVPDGTTSGISRKLPDTERARLKAVLKELVPDTAGVIVRTAAEGATEDELTRDVERLKARWEDIEAKASSKSANAQLLYGEPDLTLKVVRDLFTEDFAKLVVQGDEAWETVRNYVDHVAPDLSERLEKHEVGSGTPDLFSVYRVDEQIAKGLDRKVWLPSGGSLVIDRTEAMTVVDVNTGKFTGSGGNLEETVTKNNLEAAEEIVRQLRLRDIGGIIVVDFIDMVLENNRDLVLRRLVECLGRDRTRHQVAEVTSLGLVQMTRKRIGTGLVEAFSENCTHCQGRGIVVHEHPVATSGSPQVEPDEGPARGRGRRRGGRGRAGEGENEGRQGAQHSGDRHEHEEAGEHSDAPLTVPSPTLIATLPRHEDEPGAEAPVVEPVESAPARGRRSRRSPDRAERPERSERSERGERADRPERTERSESPESAPVAAEVPAAAPDAPAQAPTVITRTRGRRGASTAVISTGVAAVVEVSASVTAAVPVIEVAPPKVVTRTRRGASRDVVHTRED